MNRKSLTLSAVADEEWATLKFNTNRRLAHSATFLGRK